ncbi:MAG TPA: hypothetical protein VF170_15260 [Planctomycetaceae bacterium]
MKKLSVFALLLGLGLFAVGCDDTADTDTTTTPDTTTTTPDTAAPADTTTDGT